MEDEAALDRSITEQLRKWSGSRDVELDSSVLLLVYDELHRRARSYLRKEGDGHTLQTTALVHEAYLKLADQKSISWENRNHFFAIAATLMRRILVDHAKHKHREKRGGKAADLSLGGAATVAVAGVDLDLLALDEALDRLAAKEEHLARVVELRFFSGLDVPQTAEVLGVSESTVKRDWAMAKAWLHRELSK
jgi:RNA polymerase sigma factor (TIGR02999 family)